MGRLRERRSWRSDSATIPERGLYHLRRTRERGGTILPAPAIVAETSVDIPEASVSDAVMMLDLRTSMPECSAIPRAVTFKMVYRRTTGTIGWVEPIR
jgi:hypothetical protein